MNKKRIISWSMMATYLGAYAFFGYEMWLDLERFPYFLVGHVILFSPCIVIFSALTADLFTYEIK